MKSNRMVLADLICNLAIVISTVLAVGFYFWSGPDILGSVGTACFRYFTTDSNVLAAAASLCMLIYDGKRIRSPETECPQWVLLFRMVGTVSVTITLVTVLFFLAPVSCIKNGIGMFFFYFEGNVFALHLSTPVLAIVSFLLFEPEPKIRRRDLWWALLPTVVYSLVYLVMVVFVKGWTDWYGFTFGGKLVLAPVSMLVMYAVTYGVAVLLRKFRRETKKTEDLACSEK